jgi:UDP-N-acetylmuramate dehydrogenase
MNHSLKAWNTFGIDQQTNELVCAENEQQLLNARCQCIASSVLILGEGSNVLFLDTFRGTVIVNH